MTINYSFNPAVGYTGKYTMVAYGIDNLAIPLGISTQTGPFGSSVSGTIAGLPTEVSYVVKIYTDECTIPVGQITVNS